MWNGDYLLSSLFIDLIFCRDVMTWQDNSMSNFCGGLFFMAINSSTNFVFCWISWVWGETAMGTWGWYFCWISWLSFVFLEACRWKCEDVIAEMRTIFIFILFSKKIHGMIQWSMGTGRFLWWEFADGSVGTRAIFIFILISKNISFNDAMKHGDGRLFVF